MPTPSRRALRLPPCALALALLPACPVEPATGSHRVGEDLAAREDSRVAAARPDPGPRRAQSPRRAGPGADSRKATSLPATALDGAAPRPAPDAAAAAPAAEDPTNHVKPVDEAAWLAAQGQALLAAVTAGDASKAAGFFFPRKPFTPLKQAGDPDAYWQHLWRLYGEDLTRLRRRHQGWAEASFESLTLAGPPVWVPPGKEHNKLGYYRTQYARLRYRLKDQRYSIFLHTLITWQGRWYITHLGKPRPKGSPRPRHPGDHP